jgi:cyanate permease
VTVTGYILDATGSWALVFGIAAALYIVANIAWLAFAKGEALFD